MLKILSVLVLRFFGLRKWSCFFRADERICNLGFLSNLHPGPYWRRKEPTAITHFQRKESMIWSIHLQQKYVNIRRSSSRVYPIYPMLYFPRTHFFFNNRSRTQKIPKKQPQLVASRFAFRFVGPGTASKVPGINLWCSKRVSGVWVVMTLAGLKQQAATSLRASRFGSGGLTWRINSETLEIWGFQPAIFSVITDHSTGARNYQNLWLKTNMNMFRMILCFSNLFGPFWLVVFFYKKKVPLLRDPPHFLPIMFDLWFRGEGVFKEIGIGFNKGTVFFFKHWI